MDINLSVIRGALGGPQAYVPPRRPDGSPDPVRMIAEGQADIEAIEDARRERWERNAAGRAQGLAAYERAARQRAAELDEVQRTDMTLAAAAWWDEPEPLSIW